MMDIGVIKTVQHKGTAGHGINSLTSKPVNNETFSHHLLGSLNGSIQSSASTHIEMTPDLSVLSQLMSAEGLEGMELSEEQMLTLNQMGELDIGMIAEILGIDLTEIDKLHSQLQDAIPSLSEKEAEEELSLESLVSVLQLLQLSFSKEAIQSKNLHRLEELVKLSKVIEWFATRKELPITEAQKVFEVKDLLKQLHHKADTVMAGMTNQPKSWNEIMKAAYNRHIPPETATEGIKTEQNKNLQTGPGNHLHIVLPKAEQFSMTLSQAKGQMHYEKFVKDLQSILSKSHMQTQPNMSKMLIKLYPEQLGSLRIELLQHNGMMTAKILATTATAKELLDSQIQGLKHAFASQNLQVEKIEISQALTESERQSKGQSQQQSNGQTKKDHQDNSKNNEEQDPVSFKEYLVNSEV